MCRPLFRLTTPRENEHKLGIAVLAVALSLPPLMMSRGPGRVRLLEEGRMWTKGKSSATGTGEQRNFVSLFLEVFQQLMLLLCEVGD